MAEKFDEFLEEVENDIRQERLQKLWQQYGKIIIGVFVGVLAIVGLYMMWQNHQGKQREELAEKFIGAQELVAQGKMTEAMGVMQVIAESSHKNYAVLAKFSKASLLLEDGKEKDAKAAVEIYKSVANDSTVEKNLQDFSKVLWVNAEMDAFASTATEADMKRLIEMLDPLTIKENPWHFLAIEFKGLLLYRLNDNSAAVENFMALAQDAKTPEHMRLRVQLMLQTLGSELSEKN